MCLARGPRAPTPGLPAPGEREREREREREMEAALVVGGEDKSRERVELGLK